MKRIQDEFELLKKIMKGLAAQFGSSCEIVLHDYEKEYEHTITWIENGYITGRKIGDCGTNLGLEVLRGVSNGSDQYNYQTQTSDGKILRSTSIYLENDEGKKIGCLCINTDITDFMTMQTKFRELITGSTDFTEVTEVISDNVNDVLESMIHDSLNYVGKPVASMSKEDKIKGLQYLDKKGAFLIKRSADRVAKYYDISKNTIYNYLQ